MLVLSCHGTEISEDFKLNDCENQKANCSKLTEYPFTEGDIYKKCMLVITYYFFLN